MNKTLFKTAGLTASAALLAVAGIASAATITPGAGTYTFAGAANLNASFLKAACTLTLTGDVQPTSDGGVTVTVTDGSATGGFVCRQVGLKFPWTATVPASDIPSDPTQSVPLTFENVVVTAAGRNCTDSPASIPAIFSNGNPISQPSSFMFDTTLGSCGVMGTINAQNDVNVTQ